MVRIDDNGDRDADYSLLDLDPVTGRFEVVSHYYGATRWVRYTFVPNVPLTITVRITLIESTWLHRLLVSVSNKREWNVCALYEWTFTNSSTDIHWPGSHDGPPADVPECGFLGNNPECQGNGTRANPSHHSVDSLFPFLLHLRENVDENYYFLRACLLFFAAMSWLCVNSVSNF